MGQFQDCSFLARLHLLDELELQLDFGEEAASETLTNPLFTMVNAQAQETRTSCANSLHSEY